MSSSSSYEPPRKLHRPTSFMSITSLPIEIIWSIIARVSKRSYPILSCVCKTFRSIVLSQDIHKIRSLLDKDSLYICFVDGTKRPLTRNWFTLHRNKKTPTKNEFVSVSIPFDYRSDPNPLFIAVGPEIFFICGSYVPSSSLWIFDTRTQRFRRGPDMQVDRSYKSVGLVGGKVYVIGGHDEVLAESFDLKTQIWEQAPVPKEEGSHVWICNTNVVLERKVCALSAYHDKALHYDTRDGSCGSFELISDKWWGAGVCVMDNVLFIYYKRFGLMWYDSKLMLWRVVYGLGVLNKVGSVGMADYYGKLAFLWEESCGDVSSDETDEVMEETGDVSSDGTKEVWCTMISLHRSEEGIHGTAEQSTLLAIVPRGYSLWRCMSVSD